MCPAVAQAAAGLSAASTGQRGRGASVAGMITKSLTRVTRGTTTKSVRAGSAWPATSTNRRIRQILHIAACSDLYNDA